MNRLVVTVCGVNESDPNYAAALVKNLPGVEVKQLSWYHIPLAAEGQMLADEMKSKAWSKFAEKGLRQAIDHFLGDCLTWMNPDIRDQIRTSFLAQLHGLEPTVLVLHSWACVIIDDLLTDPAFAANFSQVKHIITAGCPLIAYDRLVKNSLSTSFAGKWTNFYNKFDLIAFPLAGYVNSDITDIEVTDSGPQEPALIGDAGILLAAAAHNDYWQSKQLAAAVLSS